MWTRAELKENAKVVLKGSYWEGVAVILIIWAISVAAGLLGFVIPFGGVASVLFLSLPLSVGMNFFFMQCQIAPPRIGNIFYPFEGGRYLKIVGAMAWMYLFIFLWTLIAEAGLIIVLAKWMSTMVTFGADRFYMYDYLENLQFDSSWIPVLIPSGAIYIAGMIIVCVKSLSYSMTAFILTDNPDIGYGRALKLSMAMTYGQKWRIFVLYLSFIGWALLAVLTLGIGLLFLTPYITATTAQLYVRLRDNAINNGLATPQELNVYLK
ncbi:Uncharacterized membrane protein [Sporobacter termitidis DSM 10068]|uniref:Uncharacterized membrane protein n=1 Tax=Sporobacter termitidis DSM 10068 TaxID=1123282 RepID=A0A1M5ZGU0_9FIRM|nr:DUF975 family protein [Sporobacter termitidis]SHI23495.1 Uncharacterized membrane protein [Sporobacter termitidis DSM 10068]